MHRLSPTKGQFSKIGKYNHPTTYLEIKNSKLGKMRQQKSKLKEQDKTLEEVIWQ